MANVNILGALQPQKAWGSTSTLISAPKPFRTYRRDLLCPENMSKL